jgi:hypothetical protein
MTTIDELPTLLYYVHTYFEKKFLNKLIAIDQTNK